MSEAVVTLRSRLPPAHPSRSPRSTPAQSLPRPSGWSASARPRIKPSAPTGTPSLRHSQPCADSAMSSGPRLSAARLSRRWGQALPVRRPHPSPPVPPPLSASALRSSTSATRRRRSSSAAAASRSRHQRQRRSAHIESPGIATALFDSEPLGFRPLSLFVTDRPPSPAGTSATPSLISAVTSHYDALPAYSAAAALVEPLIADWLGPQPLLARPPRPPGQPSRTTTSSSYPIASPIPPPWPPPSPTRSPMPAIPPPTHGSTRA